ncbi:hypothetical protein O0L34_g3057 [Tuta absoluta]|nr:hypothetical protein O0L34_g3057 [Tuta absoluta]
MKTKVLIILAVSLCAYAAEAEKEAETESEQSKDQSKRQTQDEFVPSQFLYRTSRKQEPVAPVEEQQEEEDREQVSRGDQSEYRPGQVFSLNAQELLDLQPERKSPLANPTQLQQLYANPQPDHRQNLQQIYYLEPQGARQVSLQPSHAVIARPHYSSNGGEASVGAALSVSDSGVSPSASYPDPELLALLGQAPNPAPSPQRHDDLLAYQQQIQASTQSVAPQYQQVSTQSVAPQYQQVDRYITKPSKKPTKLRPKVHSQIAPPQASTAPQQYLIETTNVQQQPASQQYRPAPQPQRAPQALRYAPIPTAQGYLQQALYERPEAQGLKVVAPPKLEQQPRPQLTYRLVPQYQQPEASPKQYRIIEAPRAQVRQEQRVPASSIERPVTYLKRFPEPEKMRAIKIYDPVTQEALAQQQQQQVVGQQYYLRPVYRANDPRTRYEVAPQGLRQLEYQRAVDPTKPPHSAIYVSQKLAPKKVVRPQSARLERGREASLRLDQSASVEQVNLEQHGQSLEEQRAQLPPPKNNRAYTPEEFAALVAAGYAVTPVPVAPVGPPAAQSRSSQQEAAPPPRRLYSSRRNQYLPLRGDDAP